jgi:hypothetical protein
MGAARTLTRYLAPAAVGALVLAAAARNGAPTAALVAGDSLDDGPHVYWADASHAVALYVCGGAVNVEPYQVVDTLRFRGLCADSLAEYRLAARPPAIEPDAFAGARGSSR